MGPGFLNAYDSPPLIIDCETLKSLIEYVISDAEKGLHTDKYLVLLATAADGRPEQGEVIKKVIGEIYPVPCEAYSDPSNFGICEDGFRWIQPEVSNNLRAQGEIILKMGFPNPAVVEYETLLRICPALHNNHVGDLVDALNRVIERENIPPWKWVDYNTLYKWGIAK